MADYTSSTVAIGSAAHTTTQTSANIANNEGSTLTVIFDVTALTAGASLTLTIDGYDLASTRWYNLLTSAAVTSTNAAGSPNVYTVGTGLPVTTNVSANKPVPLTFRVVVTPADNKSVTYSVGCNIGL